MASFSYDRQAVPWTRTAYLRAIAGVDGRTKRVVQPVKDRDVCELTLEQLRSLVVILEGASFAEIDSEAASLNDEETLFSDYTSDDDCEWPSSRSNSSHPVLGPIDSSFFTITELDIDDEADLGGKTFAFPLTASQCAVYHARHSATIPSTTALKPLHNALLWLFPEEEFDSTSFPAEHPEQSDLRTGAASLEDDISWCTPPLPNPPIVASTTGSTPAHGDYALSDLKTGFAAPRWSLEWLDAAEKHPSPFYPFDTAVYSPQKDTYQWIHGTPPRAPPSAFDDDDEDEDEEAEREFQMNGLYFQEDREGHEYLLHGRKYTIDELEMIACEWWGTADDLYFQGESISLQTVAELSAFCWEQAGEPSLIFFFSFERQLTILAPYSCSSPYCPSHRDTRSRQSHRHRTSSVRGLGTRLPSSCRSP